jgi:hypothetical protein
MTRYYQGELPDEVFLDGCLALLRRCDALLTVSGWEQSEGSRIEVAEARRVGLPVFHTVEDIEPWIGLFPSCASASGIHGIADSGRQPSSARSAGPSTSMS